MQIGIEDGHGLERKNLVHELGQLRPGLHVKIHLQRAASELIQIVHLAAPGFSRPRVLGNPRRQAADNQGHQHKSQQRNGVGRVFRKSEFRLSRREYSMNHYRGKRNDRRLPKSAQQRGGQHNEQIKQERDRKQPPEPVSKCRNQDHGHNSERALQRKQQRTRARPA